jgi:hydroxymethylglutaryl-CoA lyase
VPVLDQLPRRISVYEVGPRDGLQNEARTVPTADKIAFIDALSQTGLTRIEVTSFVSPRWIPQLGDAAEVVQALPRRDGVQYSALVPNKQGLESALAVGLREIAVFMSASETHNKKNVNKSIADTLRAFAEVVPPALAAGLRVRAYLSTAFGCPYEGDVDPEAVVRWTRELRDLGCYQISISDTIGVANPAQVEDVLERCLAVLPIEAAAVHFHDTQGTALANCLVAIAKGVTTVDASVGGLGGCPYAPGASGNLATEDLVAMLHAMGVDTGIDLDRLVDCSRMAAAFVGHELPSKYFKAHLGKQARVRRAAERATQKEGQG